MSMVLRIEFEEHPDDVKVVDVKLKSLIYKDMRKLQKFIAKADEEDIEETLTALIEDISVDGCPNHELELMEYTTSMTVLTEISHFLAVGSGRALKRSVTVQSTETLTPNG